MAINSICIRNFRGLRNLSCDNLARFTIIGGRNNCGKTSFLEAVEMLFAGALGSIAWRLNQYRRLFSNSWTYLASVISDFRYENETCVSGRFDTGVSRHVSLRVLPRDLSVYTDAERQDERLSRRLLVSCRDSQNGTETVRDSSFFWEMSRVAGGQMQHDSWVAAHESQEPFRFVYLSSALEVADFTHSLTSIIDAKSQGQIVETLRSIDPRIQDLVVNENMVKADVRGVPILLPVQLLGDGMAKIIAILMAVERCADGGCVCIDEIDNGLHYSTYLTMMRTAIEYANLHNVQIFATTHNKEFLDRLASSAEIASLFNGNNDFSYINLVRYDDDSLETFVYDYSQFCDAMGSGTEIR